MTTIETGSGHLTLINVFTVDPQDQQRLVDLLSRATEEVVRHRDGFISANIHASTDGTRVTNYAQWRDEAALQAMLADPVAREHTGAAAEIATSFEPHLYTVVAVHHA